MKRVAVFISLGLGFSAVMFFATTSQRARVMSGSNAASGRQIHVKNCQRCHGPQGKGDGPAGKLLKTKPADWTDKKKMSALSDAYLYKIIAGGGGAVGKSTLLPAFKGKLNDNQIRDVISFIRSL
ncbi:MAG TPA: cytochrome c [Pyrinomonadaceae bacterium]|nr:cytochrome c [Pyrinomonadaceae bacterium]